MDSTHSHSHPHPHQPDLEDKPVSHYQLMSDALAALLLEKQVFTSAELHRTLEGIDAPQPAWGARMIAHAWLDAEYRERMMEDVNAAAAELGIEAGLIPIRAIANEPGIHNVIVCTLCSCYPRALIGLPPDWYKSRAYRSRVVRNPRAVLAEFGLFLSEEMEIRVYDSTADLRYMVLPERPDGSEHMDADGLAGLVTRDCMVGTARPSMNPS